MPDVTSTDEKDWGPEQTDVPPVGSIFLLWLGPNYGMKPTTNDENNNKFKLVGYHPNADPNHNIDLERWDGKQWMSGHFWGTDKKPTFRLLRTVAAPIVASSATVIVDDYTCTLCRNPKCSTSEKSCWKCGEPIVKTAHIEMSFNNMG